jgi:hypothetical protein
MLKHILFWRYQMKKIVKDAPCGKIVYVREDIPSISIKPYKGETYEDMIPDTLDIAERAELAINVLTCATNPNADYEQYFAVDFASNPTIMYNKFDDWCGTKYMEALPLLRIINGSTYNDNVDRVWMDVTLKSIGQDGLYYIPLEGRPWSREYLQWANYIARADGSLTTITDANVTQFAHPQPVFRMISTITGYYLRGGNPVWKETNERMIVRLLELAIHKDDYCYFPAMAYEPNAKFNPNSPEAAEPKEITGGEINGRFQGVAQFYKVTGYEPARELAEKLTRFMRYHNDYWAEDGEFIAERHFHAHTIYLLSMLEHALAVDDKELMDFVRRSYEWAKTPEAGSSSLIGFFPEIARPDYKSCEGCEIGDMIALALKLTDGGAGDYYEDAERWTRNHFAESQLTKTDWLYRVAQKYPEISEAPYNASTYRVPERNIGGFAGWSSGNDFWIQGPGFMHCCTGNCTRTIYYIWEAIHEVIAERSEHILDYKDGHLRVNMLLNRASQWADVHSYIPYEGQVNIKMKKSCKSLLVHAPEWIKTGSEQLVAMVNGKPLQFSWEGRYVNLGEVERDAKVSIKFPITERTVKETIGTVDYTLILKGNTVVFIEPPGKNCPLYQREHYREKLRGTKQSRWRKVKRFVSLEQLKY